MITACQSILIIKSNSYASPHQNIREDRQKFNENIVHIYASLCLYLSNKITFDRTSPSAMKFKLLSCTTVHQVPKMDHPLPPRKGEAELSTTTKKAVCKI